MRTKTDTKPALSQRTELPNRGMAYKPRDLWPRSSHSSLRTGKPSTRLRYLYRLRHWRRGTGDSTDKTGRCAKCIEPKPLIRSSEVYPRRESPESRMKGNFHVRFGGGRLEKEPRLGRATSSAAYPTTWTKKIGRPTNGRWGKARGCYRLTPCPTRTKRCGSSPSGTARQRISCSLQNTNVIQGLADWLSRVTLPYSNVPRTG